MAKQGSEGITVRKEDNLSDWYTEVILKGELVDYAPVKGFMIIRPNGYAIWERIQEEFNLALKNRGIRNAYFPLLIPDSFFKKEATHAKGFSPELAYVKDTDEGELLAIRPTSETIMYDAYSKWIRSWRDLPLMLNQWCNVLRWEVKQTKPFLRTREFLWQEGHCAFATEVEADRNMMEMIEEYRKMVEDVLAVPVLVGRKSKMETFAGALQTMTIEAMMPDGKALQCGTSHNLGQGFAEVFDVKFMGEDGKEHSAWQTSWGFSTRLIGAAAMVHGDDKGLVLPPNATDRKIVIVPIIFEDSRKKVIKNALNVRKKLEEYGVILDDRDGYSPGWKFSEWEMKGIPLRIEIGPKDVEKKQVTIVRRDTGKKESVSEKDVQKKVDKLLDDMQKNLFRKAKRDLDERVDSAKTMDELRAKLKKGKIVKVYMEDSSEVEEALQDATGGANSRIVEESKTEGKCIQSGKKTKTLAWVAKSY